uniref:Uncharacterized protein n=1 Tax=Rhizophora mucronata TaxID=61149 RepID=A0A2P2LWS4_RHIMU
MKKCKQMYPTKNENDTRTKSPKNIKEQQQGNFPLIKIQRNSLKPRKDSSFNKRRKLKRR